MTLSQQFLKTDFAALRCLQFVHDLGSFSLAADRLGQTQSNVSYTIARLRDSFGDPLFVREKNAMIPTERCRQIVAHAAQMLEVFEDLGAQQPFHPKDAAGNITISCNHYERITLVPPLVRQLRRDAPGIRLRVVNARSMGGEQLKRGECDLLLGPVPVSGDHIFRRRLRRERYVLVTDRGNPLANTPVNLEQLATAQHIVIRFAGGWRPSYLAHFEAKGLQIDPVLELSEYGDLENCLRGTDLVAVIPERIANRFNPVIIKRDLPEEIAVDVNMTWTTRSHQSPLHQWLRNILADLAKTEP